MYISLKGPSGNLKQVKLGFSWTFLFFGFFVPLLRGDFRGLLKVFLWCLLTFGLASFYFLFKYNELYAKNLMEKGYKPADQLSADVLRAKGLYA